MKIVSMVIIFHFGIGFILDDKNATASYHGAIHSYESFKDKSHSIERKSDNDASTKVYTRDCSKFDSLWEIETLKKYRIYGGSFCSDHCSSPSLKEPYWFECDTEILPEVEYFYKQYKSCTVKTKNGKRNNETENCIEKIANITKGANFNGENSKLIYITHGFQGERLIWMYEMKDSLLAKYNRNDTIVGIVKWERGSRPENTTSAPVEIEEKNEQNEENRLCCHRYDFTYGTAALNIWPIATVLGYLHIAIADMNNYFTQTDTFCIGYGLGGHLCGFFGKPLAKESEKSGKENLKVTKIVGLDPAAPLFDHRHQRPDKRLNKDDAKFVEVIHTNAQELGYPMSLGHVDFYVNGGYFQKSCPIPRVNMTKWKDSKCSHRYARLLFKKLLDNDISCNMITESGAITINGTRNETRTTNESIMNKTTMMPEVLMNTTAMMNETERNGRELLKQLVFSIQKQILPVGDELEVNNLSFHLGNFDSKAVALKGDYIVLTTGVTTNLTKKCLILCDEENLNGMNCTGTFTTTTTSIELAGKTTATLEITEATTLSKTKSGEAITITSSKYHTLIIFFIFTLLM